MKKMRAWLLLVFLLVTEATVTVCVHAQDYAMDIRTVFTSTDQLLNMMILIALSGLAIVSAIAHCHFYRQIETKNNCD